MQTNLKLLKENKKHPQNRSREDVSEYYRQY